MGELGCWVVRLSTEFVRQRGSKRVDEEHSFFFGWQNDNKCDTLWNFVHNGILLGLWKKQSIMWDVVTMLIKTFFEHFSVVLLIEIPTTPTRRTFAIYIIYNAQICILPRKNDDYDMNLWGQLGLEKKVNFHQNCYICRIWSSYLDMSLFTLVLKY